MAIRGGRAPGPRDPARALAAGRRGSPPWMAIAMSLTLADATEGAAASFC